MARGVHELAPTANIVEKHNVPFQEIEIYTKDMPPNKGFVAIANVAAHGNGYATNETLKETIKKETAKIGGELVILTERNVSKDETIASYGSGIYMANQIQRPHLYGVAAVYSKVKLGTVVENDGTIRYVSPGSSAERAGLKEGMKVLSINGKFYNNNLVMQTEVSAKNPGDIVSIEYLDSANEKKL